MLGAILRRKNILSPVLSNSAVICFDFALSQTSDVLFCRISILCLFIFILFSITVATIFQTPYPTLPHLNSGVYAFGLFTTTIFTNAGQVVTGNQTPHFLSACRPNYTALGCQSTMQYITERRACTGNPLIVMSARKSFPSKDAALSVYSAVYTVVGWSLLKGKASEKIYKCMLSIETFLPFLVWLVSLLRNHQFKGIVWKRNSLNLWEIMLFTLLSAVR